MHCTFTNSPLVLLVFVDQISSFYKRSTSIFVLLYSTVKWLMPLPFPVGKKHSISTLLREWEIQRAELGTRPSWGGLRSVVRTRHQPGRSLGLSSSSTVWPVWRLSSLEQPAVKSCSTTVNSQPPESCETGRDRERENSELVLKQGRCWHKKKTFKSSLIITAEKRKVSAQLRF